LIESVQKTQPNKQAMRKQAAKSISSKNLTVTVSTNKKIFNEEELPKPKYKDESIRVIQ
jgi:hypothetical protein